VPGDRTRNAGEHAGVASRRRAWRLAAVAAGILAAMLWAGSVGASSGGKSGYSGNPATNGGQTCNACHDGGTTPQVALSGPTTVDAGAEAVYTLTITGGQAVAGGLDVSATDGVLGAGPDTKLLDGEVVQTGPKPASGGVVSWSFSWTAPASAGQVTLYGAGNSVDGAAGPGGDRAATDSLLVTVQVPASGNHPAVAVDDSYETPPGSSLTVVAPGVLANDTDADGDPLTAILVSGTAHGGLTLVSNGMFAYAPVGGYTGTDGFTYVANAGTVDSAPATVTIVVGATATTTTTSTTTTTTGTASGGSIYAANCAGCHGSGGEGGLGPSLQASSASLAAIVNVVTGGRGAMPGFSGTLSQAEIEAVSSFVQGLQQSDGATTTTTTSTEAPASGRDVYVAKCAGCHGPSGGGGLGPSLQASRLSTRSIRDIVSHGRGAMPGFASSLTSAQISAVASYAHGLQSAAAAATTAAASTGSELYTAKCAGCHGPSGEGGIGPSLLGGELSPDHVASVVSSGLGAMPAFGDSLSTTEIGEIAAFVVSLGGAPTTTVAPTTGEELYAARCAGCHGPSGEGGSGPRLAGKELELDRVMRIVTGGRDDMPSFETTLSNEQIRLVTDFVVVLSGGVAGETTTTSVTAGAAEPALPRQSANGNTASRPPVTSMEYPSDPINTSAGVWVALLALVGLGALELFAIWQDRRKSTS